MKKKLILIPLLSLVFAGGASLSKTTNKEVKAEGITSYQFDFETDPEDEGWTEFDADGDGYCWFNVYDFIDFDPFGRTDSCCAMSASFFNEGFQALDTDNWLISPKLKLGNYNYKLSYWVKSVDSRYLDKYRVCIGTSRDVEHMIQLYPATGLAKGPGEWTNVLVNIPKKYANKNIYLAFNHKCYDEFVLCIDDFSVYSEPPTIDVAAGEHGSVDNDTEILLTESHSYDTDKNTLTIGDITYTATPEEGYVFDKWVIGDYRAISGVVTHPVTFTAVFKEIETHEFVLGRWGDFLFKVEFNDDSHLTEYVFSLENASSGEVISSFSVDSIVEDIGDFLDDCVSLVSDLLSSVKSFVETVFGYVQDAAHFMAQIFEFLGAEIGGDK